MEFIDKLGQYEVMSLCAAWGCQYVGHYGVNWSFLLVCDAFQVTVEANVTWQLKPLVLGAKRSHVLIRPHGPGTYRGRDRKVLNES